MNATASAENDRADADFADVARVLDGDMQAFEGIVRRWQGPLVNMAWRYCRDRGRAEEMAQEAFLRAWSGLGQWRRDSSFSTWLFALAANVYRSELKRFPTETLPLEAAPEPAVLATQHSELAAQLSHDAVHRAVLALPLRYREPVVLFYFHEMDLAAAARTMGMPEGTLKARLSRARTLLRQRFPRLEEARDSRPGRKMPPHGRGPVHGGPGDAANVGRPDTSNDEHAQETGKEAVR
ncbi:MAG: RNA polymerase sigma factor [Terracidiphilus sp.]|jgi:RNA polymerase sigma-70 factor (ECF subfamily)